MIGPACSTVVAWYARLPDALARLVEGVHRAGTEFLGGAFAARDPAQVHATLIGLERAPGPFDPAPLAAHLRSVLTPPPTIRFGFAATERRLLSRGLPLHERGFTTSGGKAVLMGWPVEDAIPRPLLADVRQSCRAFGVTHRYGADPDLYLVVGDVTDAPADRVAALGTAVRAALAAAPVHVPLTAADLDLVTYVDPALPRATTSWRPLLP